MKLFFMVSLILASLNYVCGDVMVTDGQVTRLNVEHWKGTWAAPGGNFIEKLKIKVKEYKIVNPTESDAKIIKASKVNGDHTVILDWNCSRAQERFIFLISCTNNVDK